MQNFNTEQENIKHAKNKKTLKILGFIVLTIGIILSLIGLIDFFMAFGSFESPKLFFLTFIGFPCIAIGSALLHFAYMGNIAKYTAKETMPTIKNVGNTVASVVEDSIDVVKNEKDRCPYCGEIIDKDAKFCDECGKPLTKVCPLCGEVNDHDSKFCKNCGKEIK